VNKKNTQKLINLVDELGIDYDKLPNQETYQKICKLLGTNQYKIYSDQFPDVDPEIEIEDLRNQVKQLETKLKEVTK
tara:strand:+ start:384 stop:614 length:231 start_codon:yes stop_codon:yes gene_type:complete